ncbi:MAG: hypothetical protein ACO3FA_10810 [Vulcanococcus sp.]|jgi:hypothetical protein
MSAASTPCTAVRPRRTAVGLFAALVAAALAPLAPQAAHANMVKQIIVGKCSEAMQDDFKKAGKTPPTGMVSDTCTCVADGMLKRRQTLDQAKTVCVNQATQKYGAI